MTLKRWEQHQARTLFVANRTPVGMQSMGVSELEAVAIDSTMA